VVRRRLYTSVERQRTVESGRERILSAARELLDDDAAEGFSIDAVARRAGVARMTVYNQFESKAGLLEALFDALALHGPLSTMPEIFAEPDAIVALDAYVSLFGRFWTLNRRTHGRLRAAALHDDELASAMASRNERRRRGVAELVGRLEDRSHPVLARDELVNAIFVLLSFETFDALAGQDRSPEDVVPVVNQLVRAVLDLQT
jgi:AcrR family transcriptional regulator